MQKRTRNELKKILTGIKDILNIDVKTRDINSTEKIKETIKNIAFQFARENKELDPVAMSEEKFIKEQIELLKSERDKYKKLYEETANANNNLINKYENQKNKSWLKKIWR